MAKKKNPAAAAAQKRSSTLGAKKRRNPAAKRNPAHAAAVAARTSHGPGSRDWRDHEYSKIDAFDNWAKRQGTYVSGRQPRNARQRYNLDAYKNADVSMFNYED